MVLSTSVKSFIYDLGDEIGKSCREKMYTQEVGQAPSGILVTHPIHVDNPWIYSLKSVSFNFLIPSMC